MRKDMEQGESPKKMRIYVGGLGEAMTEDDLRKIFQSDGGLVDAMDIIRTKSRSFAYVDYLPSSQNSIHKLFSIYNGCAWKGGKLRLEKAKEHYLVRLKREWEEDAQFENSSADENLEVSASESFEEVPKSEQIKIFFPRLGKVKSLPISGTGTHKYSFPHVEEPPLPAHFCDCEEHLASDPTGNSEDTKTGERGASNDGVDEEEIQMMNAVMNKLFERRSTSETNYNETRRVKDEDSLKTSTGNQQLVDNKVDSDDDNLVLNVMASDRIMQTMPSDNENKMIIKAHGSSKGVYEDEKRNNRVQKKKRKSNMGEFDGIDRVSSVPTDNGVTQPVHGPASPLDSQIVDQAAPIHASRSQKSSWKALIGNTSSAAFSISHILPSVPSAGEEQQKFHSMPNEPSDPSADEEQQEFHSIPNENGDIATDAILESKSEDMESMEGVAEPEAQETISNVKLNKGRGSSWLQKSSWTQLVGEQNNTSFSIGLILPTNASEKRVQTDSNTIEVDNSAGRKRDDSVKHTIAEDDSAALAVRKDDSAAFAVRKEDTAANDAEKDEQSAKQENGISPAEAISRQMPNEIRSFDVESGETCPFMRNSRSVAEWSKIKAALTGGSKKKQRR